MRRLVSNFHQKSKIKKLIKEYHLLLKNNSNNNQSLFLIYNRGLIKEKEIL